MASEPHPDAQAFLDMQEDAPPFPEMDLADLRDRPLPDVEVESVGDISDVVVRSHGVGIPARLYTPAGDGPFPLLVWSHGGGSALGSIEQEDPTARALANATECIVASVEYRLAPENPFPAAFRDVLAVTEWAASEAEAHVPFSGELLVGGESAGGKLASGVAHYLRDHGGPAIDYQVLVYPSVNYSRDFPSYDEYDGYFLSKEDMAWFNDLYLEDPLMGYNPYAYPLEDDDFGDLPPATIVSAGFDPLQDECAAYAEALETAGVPVTHHHYDDMIHGFFSNVAQGWERAREAMDAVGHDVTTFFE